MPTNGNTMVEVMHGKRQWDESKHIHMHIVSYTVSHYVEQFRNVRDLILKTSSWS